MSVFMMHVNLFDLMSRPHPGLHLPSTELDRVPFHDAQ